MVIINPREVAAEALLNIIEEGQYNNIALQRILKQNGAMAQKDKAFVTEIVNGTLRNIFYIDYVINKFSTVKVEKMKPWILAVLRSSVYQMFFMKVPESAAVNEAVKLIKLKGFGKLSGFGNGVLRNIAKNKENIQLPDEKEFPAEFLEVKYSHPKWLIKMWLSQYAYEFVKELCQANSKTPTVTLMANSLKISREDLIPVLEKENILTKKTEFSDYGIKVSKLSNIMNMESYKKGYFHVQDESSALAIQILDPKENEKVLDVCAAPGGKSIMAAQLMKNKGQVVSRDVFEHKIQLIEENAKRLNISIIKTQLKDATKTYEDDKNKYDKMIIDAPCSGFGLLRKKADIRLNRDGSAIDELTKIQREILTASAQYVKVGGTLVYSTCTICKKENIGNVKWFVDNFDYELEDISDLLPSNLKSETAKNGYINLFPNVHGTDGFFIARLIRKG